MDNLRRYGLRYVRSLLNQEGSPAIEYGYIASGQAFNVASGAQGVTLRVGDIVNKGANQTFTLGVGAETTPTAPYGVVVNVGPHWDAALGRMVPADGVPSGNVWGTNIDRRQEIGVIRLDGNEFEIDANDIVNQSEADYQGHVTMNFSFKNMGASGEPYAYPMLHMTSVNTSNALFLRCTGISSTIENRDFTGAYVKMLVTGNIAPSTTGLS